RRPAALRPRDGEPRSETARVRPAGRPSPPHDRAGRRRGGVGERHTPRQTRPAGQAAARVFGVDWPAMFDLERFVPDCKPGHAAAPSHKAVREVLDRALREPRSVLKGLGEPSRARIGTLMRSPTLTILNVIWGPRMTIPPHNHHMWAVIGIYTGREDNIFCAPAASTLPSGSRRQTMVSSPPVAMARTAHL